MSLYLIFFQALLKHCLSFKERLDLKTVTLSLASILHFVSILFALFIYDIENDSEGVRRGVNHLFLVYLPKFPKRSYTVYFVVQNNIKKMGGCYFFWTEAE